MKYDRLLKRSDMKLLRKWLLTGAVATVTCAAFLNSSRFAMHYVQFSEVPCWSLLHAEMPPVSGSGYRIHWNECFTARYYTPQPVDPHDEQAVEGVLLQYANDVLNGPLMLLGFWIENMRCGRALRWAMPWHEFEVGEAVGRRMSVTKRRKNEILLEYPTWLGRQGKLWLAIVPATLGDDALLLLGSSMSPMRLDGLLWSTYHQLHLLSMQLVLSHAMSRHQSRVK